MAPQKLNLSSVKKAARQAFKARRLAAQHRDQRKRRCAYAVGSYACAIGVALSKRSMKEIFKDDLNEGHGISFLRDVAIVTYPDDDEDALSEIQKGHDLWAGRSERLGATHEQTIAARTRFLEAIDYRK